MLIIQYFYVKLLKYFSYCYLLRIPLLWYQKHLLSYVYYKKKKNLAYCYINMGAFLIHWRARHHLFKLLLLLCYSLINDLKYYNVENWSSWTMKRDYFLDRWLAVSPVYVYFLRKAFTQERLIFVKHEK